MSKEYRDDSDFNMTPGEMLGIIMHLWMADLIKCKDRDFILSCLGLSDFDKKNGLQPDRKIHVNKDFIQKIVDEGYKMVVKEPTFFTDQGTRPTNGMILVHQQSKRLFCMEECVNYFRQQCGEMKIDLVEETATEPTYFFRVKS